MKSLIAIQEGQITLEQIKELEAMLRQLYAQHIGPQKLTVLWNVAASHHTITDREWSRSSNVTMEVPDGLPEDQRQHFLESLDRSWRKVTGQHPDQTAFGAFDQTRYRQIFTDNLERFSALGRISSLAKTLTRAMLSKARHGVMITRFNQ